MKRINVKGKKWPLMAVVIADGRRGFRGGKTRRAKKRTRGRFISSCDPETATPQINGAFKVMALFLLVESDTVI